ncbi:AAA family ATPase [Microbacterium sp. STN6]|uniref:AAA family ATPase n=1 Tax=Microbacterium sp. STN6 TaxID=2995588 RepID=UPI002260B68F|nr:AAA family ATPase [Microbacterium sp. STN6]MCX7523453.1 AAA family ATPase [Microbacterium sp. STN6]
MWRLDKKHEDDDFLSDAVADDALHPANTTSPHTLSLGDPAIMAGNIAEPVWQRWRSELSGLGGRSPLLHFVDSPRTRIELSATHPGGLPAFITGKNTLLSSLIRDELALRNARLAAGAITTKGIELRQVRGIEAVHLAIGLAQWRFEGDEFCAPILLRPLAIRRYGRDFEIKLRGKTYLNPELARALHDQFRITLDAEAFVALSLSNGVFKPQPVIDRLRGLTSHLPWFNVQPRLVVSSFADVAGAMQADAARLESLPLDALAGNPSARRRLEEAYRPAQTVGQDDRTPATDTLLLDADEEQESVIAQIAAGNSLVVKTLPGTGGTQTIVNAIGALVAQHKRVLVVSPRRSSLDGITHRLEQVGLTSMAVSPRSLRRDLIKSITRNEKAQQPHVSEVDDALVRLRKVLLDYRRALTRRDPALGVSVLDALTQLAALSQRQTPPSTTARLARASIEALATGRDSAAQTLSKAAALGEFRYGPGDSPWYGASFSSTTEATSTHELAKKLSRTELPRLLERADAVVGQTRMRPFESLAELGIYLRLLLDVRETLDRFVPAVYDRSLAELIAATSNRRDAPGMSGTNRRRLRKLALEYVRPGVHIGDLNECLRRIQQQRTLWQRFAVAGVTPQVPVGTADVQVAYQRVAEDVARLDAPLGRAGTSASLAQLPIAQLRAMIDGLAVESEVLANLQERTALLATLRSLDLDPLLADLSSRHVPESEVSAELELAWWQSVLETLLADDRALLNANTGVLDRLEADFRLVDEAHASATGQQLAWQLAETWKIGVVDWPGEAGELRRLLSSDRTTADALEAAAPHLSRMLAPVWLASPYEVPRIGERVVFDAVFLVDAGGLTIAESVGVIRRAGQLVAFGDPVTQTPSPFDIAVSESPQAAEASDDVDVDAMHADSALAQLGELLPVFTLTRSYRAGGEDLADLVNRRFYGDKIDCLPWAGTYLGHGSLSLNYVEGGHGMPDADSGAVESVDAEVAKVVELVMDHAVNRPRESLMVITASSRHAVRVHQSVLAAFAKRKDLADFILGDRAEPFTVVTLEQSVAQSRDRVIFSIGYGRTPHGRLLSNFGALAEPGGERLLAVGMTRARRSMDIVSCFRPEDIDESRMHHGIRALAQLLAEAAALQGQPQRGTGTDDPMLADLARRLERRGLSVQLGYRGKLALVASYGGKAVAVETDAIVNEGSLRESLRLRPEVLRRLGWHYLRVHSFELFSDPDAVASRIARLIGVTDVSTATAPIRLPAAG